MVMTKPDIGDSPLSGVVQILSQEIGRFSLKAPGPQVVAVRIPEAYVRQAVPIGIDLESSWRPCETLPGNLDTRELGLAIREIQAD
ncbi:hypothetical protein EPN27_04480 [Patescibacteria group bacterium]|nr:MAG: hypothetical protein EPN27_04480 [Patescibacteria group bacterium]